MNNKIRILCLFFILVIAAVILASIFWSSIAIYIIPKAVLSDAISHAAEELMLRFDNHPAHLLLNSLDPDGKQSAVLDLKTTDALLGDIRYDMHFMAQPHQLYGEGTIYSDNKALDLSIYLDKDYMAVSSEDLLNGSYYGITYNTFQEDIRSIPLLSWMLGDAIISEWDMSLKGIQRQMQQDHELPAMPELSADKAKMLMLALLAAPADVEKTVILIQNQPLDCHRITYRASEAQLSEQFGQILPLELNGSVNITAVFYLYENMLVLADIDIQTEETAYHFQVEMGYSKANDSVAVSFSEITSSSDRTDISLISTRDGNYSHDIWQIQSQNLGKFQLSYDWNSTTGDMYLKIDDSETISLNLRKVENGFCIETDDFTKLYSFLCEQTQPAHHRPLGGRITVQPGASFTAPQYKNLDEWSMDDFLTLLEGLGGLLGLF